MTIAFDLGRKATIQTNRDKTYAFPRTHDHRQKKRIMKAEEIYSSSEGSDDEF